LEVDAGQWLSIVGPNGAGKSTLLRFLTGAAKGTGTLTIGGRPAADMTRRDRARLLALVPQTPVIPVGITVIDYVLLGRTPHIRPLGFEGQHDLDAVYEALGRLDLESFAARDLASLSGGERQRVLIARALAQEASIVLLDEPTTALDVGHQQQVLELIDALRRAHGLTVVTTMHDLTLAGQYAERLVLLDEGRVVVEGEAHEVLTEEHLASYYGAKVRIIYEGGHPMVLPLRERRTGDAAR
ncbi:MAG: ABC transporter ATP-binding protein, partial [Actinomycetota bacterium]|nr:ABC transporter ATP-binding protein [Actinomycetota bacterium]